jgi:hypothetical protein
LAQGYSVRKFIEERPGVLLIVIATALFHAITYLRVQRIYAEHLPHYDSIGQYTFMFRVMNVFREDGFSPALDMVLNYHLSWLQGFFALLGAFFLSATPESVQLYNTLAVFAFTTSVYVAARAAGAGEIKAFMLSLIVFLPDALYAWEGGFMDLRRDGSFFCLLGSTFFLFFASVWKPSVLKSTAFGVAAGLTVLSRGSAVFTLISIMAPIWGVWALWMLYARSLRGLLKITLPAALAFAIIAGANIYYTSGLTMGRYRDPYTAYMVSDDAMLALRAHWTKPISITFGRIWQLGGDPDAMVTLAFLLMFVAFAAVLWFTNKIKIGAGTQKGKFILMALAGAWALIITEFLLIFVIKMKPLDYWQNSFPFYPAMLVFLSAFFGIGGSMSFTEKAGRFARGITVSALCLGVVAMAVARVRCFTPEATPKYIPIAKEIAALFESPRGGEAKTVAFMWHDTISIDTLQFYVAQRGGKPIRKFLYSVPNSERWLDFAVGTPPGADIPALLDSMKEQIEARADYVVVSDKPGAYAIDHHFLILRHGQPVVDAFLKSEDFKPVFRFTLWGEPLVVLENLAKGKG